VVGERAQSAVEIIIIMVVMFGFVLITYSVVMQRNYETDRLFGIQKDNVTCREISGLITTLNSSQGYMDTKLGNLGKDVRIEKGSIIIQSDVAGSISCRYTGKAWLEDPDDVYVQDLTGFDLVKENAGIPITYKMKRLDIGVVFCDNAQNWCSGVP
jgi:hypothetical protein